jgi:hypothetical protein
MSRLGLQSMTRTLPYTAKYNSSPIVTVLYKYSTQYLTVPEVIAVVGAEHEQHECVGESKLVVVEHLERAGTAKKHAPLDLELEGAFLDDGLVVDEASWRIIMRYFCQLAAEEVKSVGKESRWTSIRCKCEQDKINQRIESQFNVKHIGWMLMESQSNRAWGHEQRAPTTHPPPGTACRTPRPCAKRHGPRADHPLTRTVGRLEQAVSSLSSCASRRGRWRLPLGMFPWRSPRQG